MLKISFNQLADKNSQLTELDELATFGQEFYDRAGDLIIEVKKAVVTGQLVYDKPFVLAQLRVEADIVVPSSRSLAPVELHQDFKFLEGYTKEVPSEEDQEAIDTIIEIEGDTIDLQTAVEDHILLQIPMVVLTEAEKNENQMPQGKNWEVISESDFKKKEAEPVMNPELAKLKALLDTPDNDDDLD